MNTHKAVVAEKCDSKANCQICFLTKQASNEWMGRLYQLGQAQVLHRLSKYGAPEETREEFFFLAIEAVGEYLRKRACSGCGVSAQGGCDQTDQRTSGLLWTIAFRQFTKWLRNKKGLAFTPLDDQRLVAQLADEDALADEVERLDALEAAISQLNPEDQRLIQLWLDGKRYAEIQAALGLSSPEAAKMRFHRIKEKLGKLIEKLE
jgi:DNA-binding CsgD family transcriptional regulator